MEIKIRAKVLAGAITAGILAGCNAPSRPSAAASSSQQNVSLMEALPNSEYPIEVARSGKARLQDGVFEEAAAPGSATKTTVVLGEAKAAGDLNGDGVEDGAVTLVANPGGSGTFIYLAAVVNLGGAARPTAAILLGDRIVVKALVIRSGAITVTLLTRKADEPMAAEPKVEVTRKFKVEGERLVEVQ